MRKYIFLKYYPFILIIILAISNVIMYCYFKNNPAIKEVTKEKLLIESEESHDLITVDIKGEVKKPGIYQVAFDSNINDLIKLAGGLTKNGTTSNINLARHLTDQSVIVIKSKKQSTAKVVEIPCVCPDVEITKCESSVIEIEKSSKLEGEAPKPVIKEASDDQKVHINSATKEEFMTLSGIGEAKADAIIAYRNQNGLFTKLEDLINVSGISENIFNKIKDSIEL